MKDKIADKWNIIIELLDQYEDECGRDYNNLYYIKQARQELEDYIWECLNNKENI